MDEDSPLLTPEAPGPSPDVTQREEEEAPRNAKRQLEASAAGSERPPLLRGDSTGLGSFGVVAPSAEKYRRIEKVGVGAYGNVFKAENTETKEIVAIKATFRKEDPMLGGFPLSLLREVCILRRVRHENIVQILEVAQTPKGDPLIVMEFCQASLLELISSPKHDLSLSEIKYITRQLLDATAHLHRYGILHRDLATKNVLFNQSGEIKVCDFGISRVAFGQDDDLGYLSAPDLEDPNMIVSLPYRSIELLLGQKKYGPALDVWSVGCIFAEVLLYRSGRRLPLFAGDPERPHKTPEGYVEEIFQILGKPTEETWPGVCKLPLFRSFNSPRIVNAKLQQEPGDEKVFIRRYFMHGAGKPANSKYCLTESCFDLLGGLLALCPSQRSTPAEALNHSFFTREKPTPEWHAWHWDMEKSEILRGDASRRQSYDDGDSQRLLRQLSKEEVRGGGGGGAGGDEGAGGEAPRGGGGGGGNVLERWRQEAEKRKQAEERRAAERRKAQGAQDDKLPPGWTKHWSSSKQCYYYHDKKTGKNQWKAPGR